MTDEMFHTVSDCSVLDGCGRVVGVMRDHWVAHELVDMADRNEMWCDPDDVVLNETHADVLEERDDFAERLGRTRVELEEAEDKAYEFRQWASGRISELEELLGGQGKEPGRAKIE